ncbi:NUDIX domain-containing protein [Novosphingobium lentum]|uniref:NUDIX domain-containing protein n=1 Tax=Novosphingobium lentum TaxID=145287 RepID=UPI000A02A33E|nr:NUDIX domain-containing protein [Novosphingobium lentum]
MSDTEDLGDHTDAVPAIPAATVVIFRRDPHDGASQLLMVERSAAMRFAGGAAVFPGGRIDPADYELAARVGGALDPLDAAARIAAIRETLEETGLVLGVSTRVTAGDAAAARAMLLEHGALAPVIEAFGWTLDLDALVPFARWLPRHRNMKAFDTHFYLADIGTGAVDIEVDATENRHLFWASAQQALDLAVEGRIRIIFPTRRNLERLALYPTFQSCRDHALSTPLVTITPHIVDRDGEPWLMIPDNAGYPYHGEPAANVQRG